MKRCPDCQQDIVLDAAHCPHCGAKQDARTVLGFQGGPNASDVHAALAAEQAKAAPVATARPVLPPVPAGLTAPAGVGAVADDSIGVAATLYPGELQMPGISLDGAGEDGYASASLGPAAAAAPHGNFAPPEPAASNAWTDAAYPPAPAIATPIAAPAWGPAPPQAPTWANPAGMPQEPAWTGAAQTGPSDTYSRIPRAQTVPVHGGTAIADEAGSSGLRGVSIVFGALLLVSTLGPQAFPDDGSVRWGWELLEAALDGGTAAIHGALAAAGLLALFFGAIPVPSAARAIIATIAGLGPVIAALVLQGRFMPAGSPDAEVHALLALGAFFVLPAGLLVRSRHWASIGGRLVATAGALLYVAVVTVPMRDAMPVVTAVDALATGRVLMVAISIFSVLLLGLLGLFAWLPSRWSAGAGWIAWIELAAPPLAVIGLVAKETEELSQIARNPAATVFPALWLLALGALAAYGLAQLLGRLDAWRA